MIKISKKTRIFSALEIANICGVVNQTAINWIKKGHLRAFITPGGQYRVYANELFHFLSSRGMVIPEELERLLEENENTVVQNEGSRVVSNTVKEQNSLSSTVLVISERKDGEKKISALINKLFPAVTCSLITVHTAHAAGKAISDYKPAFIVVDTDTLEEDKVALINEFIDQLKEHKILDNFSQLLTVSFSMLSAFPHERIESLADKSSYSDLTFLPKLFEQLALLVAS